MCGARRGAAAPSRLDLEQLEQRLDGRVDRLELRGRQPAQPLGEPRRATTLYGGKHTCAFGCELEPDATPVRELGATNKARGFEPRGVLRHSWRRHALPTRQLADLDPRFLLDLDQQRDLAPRDRQRVELAPQLAVETEERRPEAIG